MFKGLWQRHAHAQAAKQLCVSSGASERDGVLLSDQGGAAHGIEETHIPICLVRGNDGREACDGSELIIIRTILKITGP